METVTFEIENGPHPFVLTFDFNAIADAEPVAGCNLFQALGARGGMTATQLRGLLYAFLKPRNKDLTLADAGILLSQDMGAVTVAVAKLMGVDAGEESAEPEPVPAG